MKFDRLKRPALVSPKPSEEGRYGFSGCAVRQLGGKPFLAATDGKALTLVACELEPDDKPDGVYPVEAFAALAKVKGPVQVTLNGTMRVQPMNGSGSVHEFRSTDVSFPEVGGIVPSGEPEYVICLNAELLASVQKALGADCLRLEMHGDSVPVKCWPQNGKSPGIQDGSLGVVMPRAQY